MFQVTCSEDESLATNQEEADTKVFLCAEHAQASGFTSVGIETVDSDIPIYVFYFNSHLSIHLYINYVVQKRRQVIDVRQICSKLGINVCLALPAPHAFTGNDYTSAFVGKGKSNLMTSKIRFQVFVAISNSTLVFLVQSKSLSVLFILLSVVIPTKPATASFAVQRKHLYQKNYLQQGTPCYATAKGYPMQRQ